MTQTFIISLNKNQVVSEISETTDRSLGFETFLKLMSEYIKLIYLN